jgi:hypothetical protein
VFAVKYRTSKLFEDNCRVVSSANRILNIMQEAFGRSLIRIKKSKVPCKSRVRMSSRVDLTPFPILKIVLKPSVCNP